MTKRTLEEMIHEVGIKDELVGLDELHYGLSMGLVGMRNLKKEEFTELQAHVLEELKAITADIDRLRWEDVLENKIRFIEETGA
jgi:hypothetical protein